MDCSQAREEIGPAVDHELSEPEVARLEEHMRGCRSCACHWNELTHLVYLLKVTLDHVAVPQAMWNRIERQLDCAKKRRLIYRLRIRALASAASLGMVIGGGAYLWLSFAAVQRAESDTIKYNRLLEGLPEHPESAFHQFLHEYGAQPINVSTAHDVAPNLEFAIPEDLPTGHHLRQVYKLDFGHSFGIAAIYDHVLNAGIFVCFHRSTDRENVGNHRASPCMLNGRPGQHFRVGDWSLLHITGPSTCHCVLSKLDVRQLPAVVGSLFEKESGRP